MHNVLNSIVNHSKIAVILLGAILMGCQDLERPEKPKNLIPEDKMVEVLIDVHLFNSAKSYNRMPLQQTGMTPHQFIYEKHGIDSLQYERSNAYYGADLDKYATIHSRARSILEKRKREVDTLISVENRKKDSIRLVNDSLRRAKSNSENPVKLQVVKEMTKTDTIND